MMFFIVTKKNILISCISLFLGAVFGSIILSSTHAGLTKAGNNLTVLVDAGHGLPDGGAIGINGTVEQRINLEIAKKIKEVLSAKGINIILTREDENCLSNKKNATIRELKLDDMRKRRELMKTSNADLFISIHMNSYKNSLAEGLRIFYAENSKDIKPLAEEIQVRMSDVTGAKMSVVKTIDRNLFLLKNPPIPSILIECGFLSNPEEEAKLNTEDYEARLAWAISDAIEKYFARLITEK